MACTTPLIVKENASVKLTEKNILDKLEGKKNIINLLDSFQENGNSYIVMPRAENSLADYFPKIQFSTFGDVKNMINDILDGVIQAHAENVCHRDLKPANILKLQDVWMLGDFGASLNINSNTFSMTKVKPAGTQDYFSPEIFNEQY